MAFQSISVCSLRDTGSEVSWRVISRGGAGSHGAAGDEAAGATGDGAGGAAGGGAAGEDGGAGDPPPPGDPQTFDHGEADGS